MADEGAIPLKLEPYHWESGQVIAEDYLRHFERVQELYEYNPWNEESWHARTRWLDEHPKAADHREKLVDVLHRFNKRMGNAPEAAEQIEKLRNPETAVIVGGQQAGLFGGSLLVIHKAISIIQAARNASDVLGRPVIPVFWIAGEDHDFDEVSHLYTLSPEPSVEKIKLETPVGPRTSVSRLRISDWQDVLDAVDRSLNSSDFKAGIMNKIQDFTETSETLTDFFGKMMAWLFGSYGLVLMDSDDPELRKLEGGFFTRLLKEQEAMSEALLAGKAQVEAKGYTPQAEVYKENANLFLFDDAGDRILLQRDGETFTDKKKERSYTTQQLEEWAEKEPERFSNNVMTRPLMQDYLFPVLASVLGHGEIAYWSLIRKEFHALDMQMPILLPRNGYTLVEGTIRKHMAKFELSLDDVIHHFDERKEKWLKLQDTLGLEEHFAKVKEGFQELYQPLLEAISAINPGMAKLGDVNYLKIVEQIEFLENRATEAHASQFDAAIRQLERIRLSLYPLDKPQERVYNVLAYLNKYGDSWLQELLQIPQDCNGSHKIVYI